MASTGTTIQKQIERLKKAKSDIKASIIAKGGIVPDTALIGDYADIIKNLEDLFNTYNYNYRVAPVDATGLKEINWNNDDINYFKYNTLIPKGKDVGDTYKVSEANKQIVINSKSDIAAYKINSYFKYCPKFDTSKETDMSKMFQDCSPLTSVPLFDTSNVTNMGQMFYNCRSLTSVPLFDTSNVRTTGEMFYKCSSLITLGGFTGLKVSLDLSSCPLLTKESILNVFNKAANVTSSPKRLTLGTTNLSKLTDAEKAIATNKGWILK